MKKRFLLFYGLLFFLLISCQFEKKNKPDNSNSVAISFFNESSYKVELYKNVNPAPNDTATEPIAVLESNETKTVTMQPSADTSFGDTFYIRYYAMLKGSEFAEKPVYIPAQRRLHNISFVVRNNETKNIPQPKSGELIFLRGYVKVLNKGSQPISVLRNSSFLQNLGKKNGNAPLLPGETGFYCIDFSDFTKLFSSGNEKFKEDISDLVFTNAETIEQAAAPQFTLEEGMLYSFDWNGTDKTIKPPVSSSIGY